MNSSDCPSEYRSDVDEVDPGVACRREDICRRLKAEVSSGYLAGAHLSEVIGAEANG